MVENNSTAPSVASPASSSCPVLVSGGGDDDVSSSSAAKSGIWNRLFSRRSNTSPVVATATTASSECPVKGRAYSSSSLPASIEEAANHSQFAAHGQKIPLSTSRVISSIPRGGGDTDDSSNVVEQTVPAHQPDNSHNWQYPSEQQFYNAMRKKGYRPPIESIPSVLQIHNAVNERSWTQVCKWEKELHNNPDPKLAKFVGRPKDISPKAWWNSRVFMTQEPFDRHDWYIQDDEGGESRRYVIDFYEGKEKTGDIAASLASSSSSKAGNNMPIMKPPSMYIDVRPALDNPSAAVDRMTMFVREALPGLTGVWDSYKSSSNVAEMDGSAKKNKNDGSGN